jgi:peroxiredoxin Q/BCP
MQAFQSDIDDFEKLSAQVLGVSSDSLETHHEFAKKLNLSFPLIADDGTIRELYGGGRITYLIDQSGVIQFIKKGMPDNKEFLREIGSLQSY